ncbi:RNA polymerase sigma factor [Fumia xinanensis]|uniref:Sigma-70 family RNA polymerase sigma factor n=1 Tax=Fumia xinanensis TaxID=2763659 RepID=A0A926I2F1_9FIRM|nr:sigma-70 family RNA polymerase sigma factor [Fumia xinanensis]MBC8559498.1 sigma-70 family RNA polymerase sigma factor [Fumia xinanensis]
MTERSKMDEIISRYADMVYRIALNNMKTRHDADDVFQEVFLRCVKCGRKKGDFESEEHLKAWLIRVTINCCNKFWSSGWRRHVVFGEEPSKLFEFPEENGIHEAMTSLPPKYRNVLHLFYFEDMAVKDIAEVLKVKEPAVRMQLTRGRAMLREKLKGEMLE